MHKAKCVDMIIYWQSLNYDEARNAWKDLFSDPVGPSTTPHLPCHETYFRFKEIDI